MMNKTNCLFHVVLLFGLISWLIPTVPALSADAPNEVAGFKLGSSIDEYDFISYQNFLKEVVIDKIPGFRKGIISYGVCDRPGEIVKIKLKYLDPSKSFFKKLMHKYKKRFGEPDKFTGDSFGIVKSWKWSFTDASGRRVTMLLQHNLKNPNEVIGNMVKLYLPDQVEAERKCFNKTCSMRSSQTKMNCELQWDEAGWKQMIPR